MNRDLPFTLEVRPAGAVEERGELGQAIAVAPERDVRKFIVQFIGKRQQVKRTAGSRRAEARSGFSRSQLLRLQEP